MSYIKEGKGMLKRLLDFDFLNYNRADFDEHVRSVIHTMKCQKFKMVCFSIYCLLSTGCGKQVNQSETQDDEPRRDAITASVIKVENTSQSSSRFTFNKIGDVFLPAKIKFLNGNKNKPIKIILAKGDPVEEMYCQYTNSDPSDDNLEFDDCYSQFDYDNDGQDDPFNYDIASEPSIILMQDHVLEVVSETDEVFVEALLDVHWH